MNGCRNCQYGTSPDPMSDICDGCRNDPDTGWGGFTDHSLGKHFYSEDERQEYRRIYDDYDSDEIED